MFNAGSIKGQGKGGGNALNGDAKSMLNQMMQTLCKRPLSKTDIVYTVNQFDTQYQAILKLNCLEGKEYAGHLTGSKQAAEKSAAEQAIAANAPLLAQAQQMPKKRAAGATPAPAPAQPAAKKQKVQQAKGQVPNLPHKTDLNNAISKILRRAPAKDEVQYVCNPVGDFYQATVQISCLSAEWSGKAWAGELKATSQEAEQSAAEQTLRDVLTIAPAETEKKPSKKKKSKAEKTPEQQENKQENAMEHIMSLMNTWQEQVSKQQGEQTLATKMMLWMVNGQKGEYPREVVRAQPVVGTVVQWKAGKKSGYLKPDVPLKHEGEEYKDGKVWVAKKELPAGFEDLTEGTKVKFKVYYDVEGLGATEVTLI